VKVKLKDSTKRSLEKTYREAMDKTSDKVGAWITEQARANAPRPGGDTSLEKSIKYEIEGNPETSKFDGDYKIKITSDDRRALYIHEGAREHLGPSVKDLVSETGGVGGKFIERVLTRGRLKIERLYELFLTNLGLLRQTTKIITGDETDYRK